MKTKLIGAFALISSGFTPVALPTFVSAAVAQATDGSHRQLNGRQTSNGWTCNAETQDEYSVAYLVLPDVYLCQDYGTVTYLGVNPGGQDDPDHTFAGGASVPLGGEYVRAYTCNYPTQ